MPSYKTPGIYVEESLTPLSQAINAPGEAFAAFVGTHNQGPAVPTVVRSWSQYVSLFGDFSSAKPGDLLPYAVYQYFNNGGRQAYIVRAIPSDAVAATITLMDRAGTPAALLKLTAKSGGTWGNALYVDIVDSPTTGSGRVNIVIKRGGITADKVVETWNDVSLNPQDSRYFIPIVNSPVAGSTYVIGQDMRSNATAWVVANTPAIQTGTVFTTGAEGVASVDLVAATQLLADVQDILVLNLPGVTASATINGVITWIDPALNSASRQNIFLVVDTVAASSTVAATVTAYTALITGGSAFTATSYAAVYGPWLQVDDPSNSTAGATRLLPPGGAVLGQFAQMDSSRGVQKPPAGIDTALRGVLGLEMKFQGTDLDTLNTLGVNIIRAIPGAGFCIFGARTLKPNMPDRYVSVRRSLMYIKKAITDNTRYAIFEPNNDLLWDSLAANCSQFLMTMYQIGVLKGATPEAAFYVKCDSENNPPSSVANGEVHLEVGLAISSPAEFIVIKIGQFDGGVSVDEDGNATVSS